MLTSDLFREMETLRREVDSLFRHSGLGRVLAPALLGGETGGGELPPVNLWEDTDNFYVEALLPGVDGESIDLNLMQRTLTIAGERKDQGGDAQTWHRRERAGGRFMRTVELPLDIDLDRVSADCSNGVLTVTLPKAEAVKPRRINIKAD